MPQAHLSKADSKVLAQVFDPEASPDRVEVIVDPTLASDPHIHDNILLHKLKCHERDAITLIEQCEEAGGDAECKDKAFESAMVILDHVICNHPNYASARNNRAQLRRWRFGDRSLLCQPRHELDQGRKDAGMEAVADLKAAIALVSPARAQDAVSPSQGRLLAQSYTQLGAIYYAAFKDLDEGPEFVVVEIDGSTWSRDRFEEEASRLFYLGGLYGNEVAKALAVHTNPHAKLCGSIVQEAMKKELAGMQT